MPDLTPLIPDSDGTNTNAQTTGVNFWTEVNTDPTANPTPASYIWGAPNAAAETFLGLTSTDSDFDSMDTLSVEAAVEAASFNDDSSDLFAQVFASDEVTPYTDEITLAQVITGALQGTSPFTGNFTVNAAGLAASKADWDGAVLQLRWDYNKLTGNDNGQFRVHAVEVNGTYTAVSGGALLEIINESVQSSEGSLRFRSLARILSESVQSSEGTLRLRGLSRIVSETVQVSEAVLRVRGLNRVISESLSISEAIEKYVKDYESEVLADSPIAYWRLDETTGTNAGDSSGSNFNGTYDGSPTLGAGALIKDGTSVDFSGGSHVRGTQHATTVLGTTSNFTIEAWIRADTLSGKRVIWKIGNATEGVNLHTDGTTLYLTRLSGGTAHSVSAAGLSADTTYHVVAIWRNNGTSEIYLNASQAGSDPNSVTSTNYGTAAEGWDIATAAGAAGNTRAHDGTTPGGPNVWQFDGRIDEAAVYRSALSATRIQAHYDAGAVAGILKIINETLQSSEAFARLRALNRIAQETLELAETTVRPRTMARLRSETVETAETTVRPRALARLWSETVEAAESTVRSRGLTRLVSESVQVAETIVDVLEDAAGALLKVINETVQSLEATSRARSLVRRLGESISIQEGVLRPRSLVRLHASAVQVGEGVLRAMGLRRVTGESVETSESTLSALGFIRVISETLQIGESVVRSLAAGLVQIVSESVQVGEDVLSRLGLLRVLSETVQTIETTLRTRSLARILSETLESRETVLRSRTLARVLSEAVQITESLVRVRTLVRIRSEVMQIVEAIVRATPGVDALVAAMITLVPSLKGTVEIEPSLKGDPEVEPSLKGNIEIEP